MQYIVNRHLSSGHKPDDIVDSSDPSTSTWDFDGMLSRGHLTKLPPDTKPPTQPESEGTEALSEEPKPKVNLNTATQSEIEALPSLGKSSVKAIVDARPIASLEKLQQVIPHVKGDKWEALKTLIEL